MRRRRDRLLLAFIVALAAVGVLLVVTQPRPERLAADFTLDYSAGTLLREGQFAAPYQQDALVATIHRVAPQSAIDPRLPYNKPLAAALPAALLALLPIDVAFRVWQAVSLLLLLGSLTLLQGAVSLGRKSLGIAVVALLGAAPAWATLTEGQVTPLVLVGAALLIAVAAGGESKRSGGPAAEPTLPIAAGPPADASRAERAMRACEAFQRRGTVPQLRLAVAAAAGGALIAVKPQYVPAYLLTLLAARYWQAFVASAIGAAVILMSPLIGGPAALVAMLHNALLANQAVSIHADETWSGVLGSVMPWTTATLLGASLYVAMLLTLGAVAWRRRLDLMAFAAVVGVLTVLASPHALPHDLLLLAVPAWLSFALNRRGALPDPTAAWLLIDLALIIDLRGFAVPLAPIVMTATLAWMVWRFRQPAARQQRHPPVALAG